MTTNHLTRIILPVIIMVSFDIYGQANGSFSIAIEQNNKKISPLGGSVKLKKSPFRIIITLSEPMGVLINASFKADSYQKAKEGAIFSEIPGFKNTGMAEGLNNMEKNMMIFDEAPSYWFYDDEETNRFDVTNEKNGQIICERLIKSFYLLDTNTSNKISDISSDIYLVFISCYWSPDFSQQNEVQRDYLKLEWIN